MLGIRGALWTHSFQAPKLSSCLVSGGHFGLTVSKRPNSRHAWYPGGTLDSQFPSAQTLVMLGIRGALSTHSFQAPKLSSCLVSGGHFGPTLWTHSFQAPKLSSCLA